MTEFIYTLIWHPIEDENVGIPSATTRPEFPSYSWSSNIGKVAFPLDIEAISNSKDEGGSRLLKVTSTAVLPFTGTLYSEGYNMKEVGRAAVKGYRSGYRAMVRLHTKLIFPGSVSHYALLAEWESPESDVLRSMKASLPDKSNEWLRGMESSNGDEDYDETVLNGRVVHALKIRLNGRQNMCGKGFVAFSSILGVERALGRDHQFGLVPRRRAHSPSRPSLSLLAVGTVSTLSLSAIIRPHRQNLRNIPLSRHHSNF